MEHDGIALLEEIARGVAAFAAAGRRVTDVGAFHAVVDTASDLPWLSLAIPRLPGNDDAAVRDSLPGLRAHFAGAGRDLRFELFEALHPRMARLLEEAGFTCIERQPIMACAPADLRPPGDREITVTGLRAEDPDPALRTFVAVRATAFGHSMTPGQAAASIAALRRDLAASRVAACIATVDGAAACAGSLQGGGAAAELVGIGTLPAFRRRGAGSAVSAWLAARHFEDGGTVAWLTAGNDEAGRVYRAVGFRPLGSFQLTFEDRAAQR